MERVLIGASSRESAVLRAGRDAGAEVGVLQSTEMTHSVYERMGFETIVEYHPFHPAE